MNRIVHRFYGTIDHGDEIADARIRPLFELWRTRKGDRPMPARADFLAEEFGPWMPHLALYEVEPSPFRLKVRLSGTEIVRLDGRDLTGRYLDEGISPDAFPNLFATYHHCVDAAKPFFEVAEIDAADWEYDIGQIGFRHFEKLLLPLSARPPQVEMVLAAIYADYDAVVGGSERTLRDVVVTAGLIDPRQSR